MQNTQKPDNGLINILVNIVIPVLILNKLSHQLGPVSAVLLALSFPLIFGAYDLIKNKRKNFFSLLGLLNILITGGFALLHLDGIWFAVKEAAFPLLIGLFVTFSSFSAKPFIETLFFNPQLINVELIEEKLAEHHKKSEFHKHLRQSTIYLSLSFYFSAIGNFIIAIFIFKPIDPTLSEAARGEILNQQIAQMTAWGAGLLIIPSMIFLAAILWYLMNGIQRITGLKSSQIIRS